MARPCRPQAQSYSITNVPGRGLMSAPLYPVAPATMPALIRWTVPTPQPKVRAVLQTPTPPLREARTAPSSSGVACFSFQKVSQSRYVFDGSLKAAF